MDNKSLLTELENLAPKSSFASQSAVIEWTSKVSALLNKLPNKDYYEVFRANIHYLCLPLSADLQNSAYNIMKSQLDSAIEELKIKTREEQEIQGKHFPANSHLDIQKYVSKIISRANNMLWICDPYLDQLIVEDLTLVGANKIKILTNNPPEIFKKRLAAAKKQFQEKTIEVRLNNNIHDRYFILDKSEIWSIGTSYNEKAGKKPTTIQQIKDDAEKIIADYEAIWSKSEILK